ncbi:hypothetical protein E2C01_055558 [Portunus trituberculatus]|uniref:Uncharacterized protein n=1 Tax=Portunus trituberculatus TaxID=210409 RepID=A0A5B7GV42_PORTR|nr:hypothetical protein [Portunus trituberculatus]
MVYCTVGPEEGRRVRDQGMTGVLNECFLGRWDPCMCPPPRRVIVPRLCRAGRFILSSKLFWSSCPVETLCASHLCGP